MGCRQRDYTEAIAYKAVVLPKLLYVSEVYVSATRCNIRNLEPVHSIQGFQSNLKK